MSSEHGPGSESRRRRALIVEIENSVHTWLAGLADGADVQIATPPLSPNGAEPAVCLYLYQVLQDRPVAASNDPLGIGPHVFKLKFLVTAWAEEASDEHALFDRLLSAALIDGSFELDVSNAMDAAWPALGIAPRPCFTVTAAARLDRELPVAKPVLQEAELTVLPSVPLSGVVVGPGDVPLANVDVVLPYANLSTRTDERGRFSFGSAPADVANRSGRVYFKGRSKSFDSPVNKESIVVMNDDGE